MSDERIPDDIALVADEAVMALRWQHIPTADYYHAVGVIARAILAERNRVHKQLKGEGAA